MDICNHKQLLSTMNLVLEYLNGNQLYCGYLSMKSEEYPFTEVEEKIEQQKDAMDMVKGDFIYNATIQERAFVKFLDGVA